MAQVTELSIHNSQMLDRLQAAITAAQQLSRKGFVLAGVEIGPRNPLVWVEYTEACKSLPAGTCVLLPGGDALIASAIDGVQVQWLKRRLAS